jgi:hypothetical protein
MFPDMWLLAEAPRVFQGNNTGGFVAEAARRPSPYPGVAKMTRDQRADVLEAFLRIGSGSPFTPSDIQLVVKALGADGLLPERTDETQQPDLSWADLFSAVQASAEKVVALVQASLTKREDGRYEFRPFCTATEMDQAWTAARIGLDPVWQVVAHPSVPTRVLMVTIVQAVVNSLAFAREQGAIAVQPIEHMMALMRGLIDQHPMETAEFLQSHPELKQLLDIAMGTGGRMDSDSGEGSP